MKANIYTVLVLLVWGVGGSEGWAQATNPTDAPSSVVTQFVTNAGTDCAGDNTASMSSLPGGTITQAINGDDFIQLERSDCGGSCAAYRVRITGNGNVTWHGMDGVEVKGEASSNVEPTAARQLMQDAVGKGFWALCKAYSKPVTENATYVTSLSINGRRMVVSDYAGAAPVWVRNVDDQVDQLANTHQWRHGSSASEIFRHNHLVQDSVYAKPGVTLLMKVVVHGNTADVDTVLGTRPSIDETDSSGWTALMYAVQGGKIETVRKLLKAGADPTHKSLEGETPMYAAVLADSEPVTRLRILKEAGVNINEQDSHGTSVLMVAAERFWVPNLIARLLEMGADPTQRDRRGRSVLDFLERAETEQPNLEAYQTAKTLLASH